MFSYRDSRGSLLKIFQETRDEIDVAEIFLSQTEIGFVRGLHLQVGRAASTRIIATCLGEVYSVFLDLRPYSTSFGQIQCERTLSHSPRRFIVPPGVAHGFQALSQCNVVYASDKVHCPELDTGVNPLSLGIRWPIPVSGISDRDRSLPTWKNFIGDYASNYCYPHTERNPTTGS